MSIWGLQAILFDAASSRSRISN